MRDKASIRIPRWPTKRSSFRTVRGTCCWKRCKNTSHCRKLWAWAPQWPNYLLNHLPSCKGRHQIYPPSTRSTRIWKRIGHGYGLAIHLYSLYISCCLTLLIRSKRCECGIEEHRPCRSCIPHTNRSKDSNANDAVDAGPGPLKRSTSAIDSQCRCFEGDVMGIIDGIWPLQYQNIQFCFSFNIICVHSFTFSMSSLSLTDVYSNGRPRYCFSSAHIGYQNWAYRGTKAPDWCSTLCGGVGVQKADNVGEEGRHEMLWRFLQSSRQRGVQTCKQIAKDCQSKKHL